MIDVKELRVGNLVLGYYAYNDENDQEQEITSVCRVLSIDSVGAHEYPLWVETIGKANDVEEYDGFVAIPLTEDWLWRFGFGKVIGWFITTKPNISLELTENNDNSTKQWYCYIRNKVGIGKPDDFALLRKDLLYVHQLQNLYFALTGKELELTETPEQ